jgi:hypothetical protein
MVERNQCTELAKDFETTQWTVARITAKNNNG